jgi:hypothetical protein
MRWISGLSSSALLAFAAAPALASPPAIDPGTVADLFGAAYAHADSVPGSSLSLNSTSTTHADGAVTLTEDRFVPGQGVTRWTVKEAALPTDGKGKAADVVRVTTTSVDPRGVAALALRPGVALDPTKTEDVDVAYIRGWPSALRLRTGRGYGFAVTPHAGLGISSHLGGSAEAGATVSFGANVENRFKGALGVKDGRKTFGDTQRWYLFAAASGKAVGLNLINSGEGLQRSGVTMDKGGFVGKAQAGIAWRKGAMQASFGYVHEKLKSHLFGVRSQSDDRLALTLAFHPH